MRSQTDRARATASHSRNQKSDCMRAAIVQDQLRADGQIRSVGPQVVSTHNTNIVLYQLRIRSSLASDPFGCLSQSFRPVNISVQSAPGIIVHNMWWVRDVGIKCGVFREWREKKKAPDIICPLNTHQRQSNLLDSNMRILFHSEFAPYIPP